MDGIAEVLGTEPEIYFGHDGRRYRLGMLSVDDWAMMSQQVLEKRPDALRVAFALLPLLQNKTDKTLLLEQAWSDARRSQIVPFEEVCDWMKTPEGASFAFWLALRHYDQSLTLELVRSWVRPIDQTGTGRSLPEIMNLTDQVHGLPPAGPI